MKHLVAVVLFLACILPRLVSACGVSRDESILVKQFIPYAEASTRHWPKAYEVRTGGILAFLVPTGTKISVKATAKGSIDPLAVVKPEFIRYVSKRLRYVDPEQEVDFDPKKYEWLYLRAVSYGKAVVTLAGPRDWNLKMDVGIVYPPVEEAVQREPVSERLSSDSEPELSVDSYDNIWLSAPGDISDHWTLEGGDAVGFRLTRIEQQNVPYGDPDRVRLFLQGKSSARSGVAAIKRTGASGSVVKYPFKIFEFPTAFCN